VKRFVFRAQAAIELRRRRERDALARLAEADRAIAAASRAAEAARLALDDGRQRLRDATASADRATPIEWYRNWIHSLVDQVAARRRALTQSVVAGTAARTAVFEARRDLRALERLRARAWARYQEAARRAEQREMDAIAVQQHADALLAARHAREKREPR
jgi:flagellar export protein FliJ